MLDLEALAKSIASEIPEESSNIVSVHELQRMLSTLLLDPGRGLVLACENRLVTPQEAASAVTARLETWLEGVAGVVTGGVDWDREGVVGKLVVCITSHLADPSRC